MAGINPPAGTRRQRNTEVSGSNSGTIPAVKWGSSLEKPERSVAATCDTNTLLVCYGADWLPELFKKQASPFEDS